MAAPPCSRRRAALLALCATLAALSASDVNGQTLTFACADNNNAAQCAALRDFYYGTNGPTTWLSTATSGWAAAAAGTKTNMCSLYGVTCTNGNVVTLCVRAAFTKRVHASRMGC
jgi:hypothetical protein